MVTMPTSASSSVTGRRRIRCCTISATASSRSISTTPVTSGREACGPATSPASTWSATTASARSRSVITPTGRPLSQTTTEPTFWSRISSPTRRRLSPLSAVTTPWVITSAMRTGATVLARAEPFPSFANQDDGLREHQPHRLKQVTRLLLGVPLQVHALQPGDRHVDRELDCVVRPGHALGALHLLGELGHAPAQLVRVAEEAAEGVFRGHVPESRQPGLTPPDPRLMPGRLVKARAERPPGPRSRGPPVRARSPP